VKQSENTAQEWERRRNVRSFFNPAPTKPVQIWSKPSNSCRERPVELNRLLLQATGKSGARRHEAPSGSAAWRFRPPGDFNSLFEVLTSDPDRYVLNQLNVFPCAIGRSFYEQVLPAESVHLGWCSNAAMWLRRVPSLIPGHFWSVRSTGAARAAFERQAAEDWEAFLSLRVREMRPGARLVVVLPALTDDESSGIAELMDHANAVLQEMVEEAEITAAERASMVLGSHQRRKDELLAPFATDGHFQRLVVEDYGESVLPDAAWAEYQNSCDKQALARKRALFFRSTFMPSLASALTRVRDGDPEALPAFADRLESGLTRRLLSHPVPAGMFIQTITLAKSG